MNVTDICLISLCLAAHSGFCYYNCNHFLNFSIDIFSVCVVFCHEEHHYATGYLYHCCSAWQDTYLWSTCRVSLYSENARMCAKWQWHARDCVTGLHDNPNPVTTVECVSLSIAHTWAFSLLSHAYCVQTELRCRLSNECDTTKLHFFLAATKQLYEWLSQSVCPSVAPFSLPSWNFQTLLPMTEVMSMQKVKVRGERSRSQRSNPNLAVSGP